MGRTECLAFLLYMTLFFGSSTHTLYIMQMHFLLPSHYFSEWSLPKVNVFVSNRVDVGSVTAQNFSPLAVTVSSKLCSYLYCPSRALSLSLHTSIEERISSPFDMWKPYPPTSPNAQQNSFGCLEGSLYQNFTVKTFHSFTQLSFLHQHSCFLLFKKT